jgi:hypothetical protein
MKALATLIALGLGLTVVCCAQRCPDPKLRGAAIGGDTIDAYVSLQQRPLKFTDVRLLSSGKILWAGPTDDNGSFHIKDLRPGTYHLTVKGWGSATVRISPDLTHSFGNGRKLDYGLFLRDNECIWTLRILKAMAVAN